MGKTSSETPPAGPPRSSASDGADDSPHDVSAAAAEEPAEPLERARLQAEVARQRVRIAKEELKRARKRVKEAKREAKRARKHAAAARKAWKKARKAHRANPAPQQPAQARRGRQPPRAKATLTGSGSRGRSAAAHRPRSPRAG